MKLKSAELVNAIKASFELLGSRSQTSVDVNKLRSARLNHAIKATYDLLVSQLGASTSSIKATFDIKQYVLSSEQGFFVRFARFIDTVELNDPARPVDTLLFGFFKSLTDSSRISDDAVALFNKVLFDNASVSDSKKLSVIKGALDFSRVFDEITTKHVNKRLTDESSASERIAKRLFRGTADQAGAADNSTRQFGAVKFDAAGASESHSYVFGKPLADGASSLDAHALLVSKPFEDVVDGFEDHVIIYTKKAPDDVPVALDAFAYALDRGLLDDAGVGETHSLGTDKVLYEIAASAGDQTFLFAKKASDDTTVFADRINTKDFGKALEDSPAAAELFQFFVAKPTADTFGVSDAPSLEPGKVFADVVDNIGSHTALSTAKPSDDTFGVADQLDTRGVGKYSFDNLGASDTLDTLDFGKGLSDTTGATDAIDAFETTKQLTDSVFATDDVDGAASILDDQEMQFMKQRTDAASVDDSIFLQMIFLREFLDAMAAQDVAVRSAGKVVSEGSSASDSLNMLTGKHIYDIPVASESLAYTLARVRSDSALLGDATVVTPGKVLLDLTSTADAGSLRSQGYADFTYFAEDFVGASRTF